MKNKKTPVEDVAVHDEQCQRKYRQRHMIALIVGLFLLGGLSSVSALYYSAANTQADKDEEIVSLKYEIDALNYSGQNATNKLAEINDEGDDSEDVDAGDVVGRELNDSDLAIPSSSTYTAKIGKFTLTVDDPYKIIINNDAGFEGGPITMIEVAEERTDGNIDGSNILYGRALISANSALSSGDLQQRVDSLGSDGGVVKELDSMTIGGVKARVFEVSGFGISYRILMEQNDRAITMTFDDIESERAKALINGLSF